IFTPSTENSRIAVAPIKINLGLVFISVTHYQGNALQIELILECLALAGLITESFQLLFCMLSRNFGTMSKN
ncbi:MAG: hypothetical protein KAX20_06955, partial [Candidatus Omnitrophica bacterium]|nr:hypothetical protein [Candidatus Omnitrophota bacterium]